MNRFFSKVAEHGTQIPLLKYSPGRVLYYKKKTLLKSVIHNSRTPLVSLIRMTTTDRSEYYPVRFGACSFHFFSCSFNFFSCVLFIFHFLFLFTTLIFLFNSSSLIYFSVHLISFPVYFIFFLFLCYFNLFIFPCSYNDVSFVRLISVICRLILFLFSLYSFHFFPLPVDFISINLGFFISSFSYYSFNSLFCLVHFFFSSILPLFISLLVFFFCSFHN